MLGMSIIKHYMLLLAGVLIMVGCQSDDITPMQEMVDIVIDTKADDTRTYINESRECVEWSSGDKIAVFENDKWATSRPATITNGKALFSTTFIKNTSTRMFTYNAVYPASCYTGGNSANVERIGLSLPATQSATATSFDPEADILIAKTHVTETQAQILSMQFKRIVAMAKLSITGLPTGTHISEVVFTANGKALTGVCHVNLNAGEVVEINSAEDSVVVAYGNSITATTPIYFNCYPTTLSAGDSFSVTITTDSGNTYTKNVTLPAGRTLSFEEGNLNTFSVDMSGIAEVKPAITYEIGKIYDINGTEGVAYAIKTDKQNRTWAYFFSMDEADLQWSTENVWCNCISDKGSWNTYDPFDPKYSQAEGGVRDINNYPAFKWCMEHGDGWFMPSSDELQWMWDAISDGTHDFDNASVAAYNKLLTDNGGMPFFETYYWSSNETANDMIEVIAFMSDSIVSLAPYKSNTLTVRATYRIQVDATH